MAMDERITDEERVRRERSIDGTCVERMWGSLWGSIKVRERYLAQSVWRRIDAGDR